MLINWKRWLGWLAVIVAAGAVIGVGVWPVLSEQADGQRIFLVIGLIGLVGSLGLIVTAWRWWGSPRSPAPLQAARSPKQDVPPAPPVAADIPYLQSTTAKGPRNFPLDQDKLLVGRAAHAHIRIDDSFHDWETVSREHAWIYRRGDEFIVEDNGSMNGIYVNGRRTRRNLLKDGWQLKVGGVSFIFYENGGREERSTA